MREGIMRNSPRATPQTHAPYKAKVTSILCNLTDEQRRQFTQRANQAAQRMQRLESLEHTNQEIKQPANQPVWRFHKKWRQFLSYLRQLLA